MVLTVVDSSYSWKAVALSKEFALHHLEVVGSQRPASLRRSFVLRSLLLMALLQQLLVFSTTKG
jgi:hypothetical protein